jgi:hypothetical protein
MRPKSEKIEFKDKICEKCGSSLWSNSGISILPIPTEDGIPAYTPFVICAKCETKALTKEGDVIRGE